MKHISLISNTGIQFVDFKIDLGDESESSKLTTLLAEIIRDYGSGKKEHDS